MCAEFSCQIPKKTMARTLNNHWDTSFSFLVIQYNIHLLSLLISFYIASIPLLCIASLSDHFYRSYPEIKIIVRGSYSLSFCGQILVGNSALVTRNLGCSIFVSVPCFRTLLFSEILFVLTIMLEVMKKMVTRTYGHNHPSESPLIIAATLL